MLKYSTRRLARALLIGSLLVAPACHPPTSIVTPQGKIAWTADSIVVRVNRLEKVAIQANTATPKGLDDKTTKALVEYAVAADKILKSTPAGWQASITSAWTLAKKELPANLNPAVAAAVDAVDVVLATLSGGAP